MSVLQTYQSVGNREDLIDVVTMISPTDTPFMSSIGNGKATGMYHEWLTDSLASPGLNAVVEGSDATFGTLTPRVRQGNYVQNLRQTGQVSDNQIAVLKAGVKDEYAYQLMKATKLYALDQERALIQGSKAAGSASAAATMGGLLYWTTTNKSSMAGSVTTGTAQSATSTTIVLASGMGSGFSANDQILLTGGTGAGQYRTISSLSTDTATVPAWDITPDSTTTYAVYHTPGTLSETVLNDNLQLCYEQGGNPDTLFVSPKQKRAISNFASSIRRLTSTDQKIVNSVDIYESDFGVVNAKTNRWLPNGIVAAVERAKWKVAYLRPIKAEELARTGSSRKFMIEGAVTLESLAENASGLVLGAA